jgi:hypothetical protein
MADDTAKIPYGMPQGYMMGMGRPPIPPPIAPSIATPTSNFCFGGYDPYFDGMFAHQTTTNPYMNYLQEGTNITEFNINRLAMFGNMQGSGAPDPNLSFYNNMLAGGLTQANQVYKSTMANTQPTTTNSTKH